MSLVRFSRGLLLKVLKSFENLPMFAQRFIIESLLARSFRRFYDKITIFPFLQYHSFYSRAISINQFEPKNVTYNAKKFCKKQFTTKNLSINTTKVDSPIWPPLASEGQSCVIQFNTYQCVIYISMAEQHDLVEGAILDDKQVISCLITNAYITFDQQIL